MAVSIQNKGRAYSLKDAHCRRRGRYEKTQETHSHVQTQNQGAAIASCLGGKREGEKKHTPPPPQLVMEEATRTGRQQAIFGIRTGNERDFEGNISNEEGARYLKTNNSCQDCSCRKTDYSACRLRRYSFAPHCGCLC